jgi:hypothetical protein
MKRFGLLWAGAILTLVLGVLAFTPILWVLAGSPNETYPELFPAALLPLAILIVVAGLMRAYGIPRPPSSSMPDADS